MIDICSYGARIILHCRKYNCFGFITSDTACCVFIDQQKSHDDRVIITIKSNDEWYKAIIMLNKDIVELQHFNYLIDDAGVSRRVHLDYMNFNVPHGLTIENFNEFDFHKLVKRLLKLKAFA